MQQGSDTHEPPLVAGEIVYLQAEVPAVGRIHEIGARALVLDVAGDELTLQIGDVEWQIVSCSPTQVVRAGLRRARTRCAPCPRRWREASRTASRR